MSFFKKLFSTPQQQPQESQTTNDGPSGVVDPAPASEQMDGAILVVSAADGPMPDAPVPPGELAPEPGDDQQAMVGGFKSVGGLEFDGDVVDYREGGPPSQALEHGGVEYPNLSFQIPESDSDAAAADEGHNFFVDETGVIAAKLEGFEPTGPGGGIVAGDFNYVEEASPPDEPADLMAPPAPQPGADERPTEEVAFYYNKIAFAPDVAPDELTPGNPGGPDAAPAWEEWFDDFAINGNNGSEALPGDAPPVAGTAEYPNISFHVPEAEPAGGPAEGDDAPAAATFGYDGAKAGYEILAPSSGIGPAPPDPAFGRSDSMGRTSPDVIDPAAQDTSGPAGIAVEPGDASPGMVFMKIAGGTQDSAPPADVPVAPLAEDEAGSLITGQEGVEAGSFQKVSGLAREFDAIEDDEPSTLADLSRGPSLPAPVDPPPDWDGDFQDDDLPSL